MASHLVSSSFSALGSISVFWKCTIFQMPSRLTIVNEALDFAAATHGKWGSVRRSEMHGRDGDRHGGCDRSDRRGFDARRGLRRHALVDRNVAFVHGSFPAPIMAHHVDPLHVLCVQVVHRFHVMPIPGIRELVHECPHCRFISGTECRRCVSRCRIPCDCILTGQLKPASALKQFDS